jgi:hypothetical protein
MAYPLSVPKVETLEDYRKNKKAVDKFLKDLKNDPNYPGGRDFGEWRETRHAELQRIGDREAYERGEIEKGQGTFTPGPHYNLALSMASEYFDNDVEKYFKMSMRKEDPSMYRSDGTLKSAVGWKGPIKNNITGKTMTELSIGAPNTEEGFYPLINPYTTDEQIEFIKNNNFEGKTKELHKTKIGKAMLANARRHYDESLEKGISPFFEDNKMKGGFIDMEEGGEVPSLTSEVLPNETVQPTGFVDNTPSVDTVDTTQGFYANNPAPGESLEDFENRTRTATNFPRKEELISSYRPPEGYVSPRVANPFLSSMGYGEGNDTNLLNELTNVTFPDDVDNDLVNALTVLGTAGDVITANTTKSDSETQRNLTLEMYNNMSYEESLGPNEIVTADDVKQFKENFGIDLVEGQGFTQNLKDSGAFDISYEYRQNDKGEYQLFRKWDLKIGNSIVEGVIYNNNDLVDNYKNNLDMAIAREKLKQIVPRDPITGEEWASEEEFDEYLRSTADSTINEALQRVANKTLFTMQDGTYDVALKDLYDEMAAGILTGLVTGDGEKALIASGAQFVKSEVVESYALKAAKLAGGINTEAGKAVYKKWRGYGGAATTMAATLALGGDEEAALTAGVQHLVTELGAKTVGEMFGTKAAETLGAEALGGATIAAVVGFLRTGDVKQAAISGVSSYLFSVNPILGMAAMALQFIMAKEPSFESGYASFDFDNFELNSYSQGDYDSGKANPDNVEFSKQLTEPLIPYLQELEKSTGFDFKGDLQIHYAGNKKGAGIYYTIGNRDQEGLDAKGMFLNRLDYYDGKDQSTQDGGKVYRRHFPPTDEGLEAMYEALYADLAYIAENKITDLTHYTGVIKSAEEIRAQYAESGYNMNSFTFMQDGGKILDKNQKVLYNSNQAKNYGLVDKKGKAPPSARADDVPMTLKEGDYVLSQPAVALYGEDTINRMVQRAANEAGTNLKSGGKVPVNVHNGEYIIPKKLTEYIGSNVLENMNNRGLMSVGERPNT